MRELVPPNRKPGNIPYPGPGNHAPGSRLTSSVCLTVAKTRTQLNRNLAEGQKLPWPPFGKQWYAGCTTLIIGNSAKAGIRMFEHVDNVQLGYLLLVKY